MGRVDISGVEAVPNYPLGTVCSLLGLLRYLSVTIASARLILCLKGQKGEFVEIKLVSYTNEIFYAYYSLIPLQTSRWPLKCLCLGSPDGLNPALRFRKDQCELDWYVNDSVTTVTKLVIVVSKNYTNIHKENCAIFVDLRFYRPPFSYRTSDQSFHGLLCFL
jgi:hypothetical protein